MPLEIQLFEVRRIGRFEIQLSHRFGNPDFSSSSSGFGHGKNSGLLGFCSNSILFEIHRFEAREIHHLDCSVFLRVAKACFCLFLLILLCERTMDLLSSNQTQYRFTYPSCSCSHPV